MTTERSGLVGGLDLEALPNLSIAELRVLWAKHMGRAAPPVQKALLIRELAWRTQERLYGGFDPQTARLLRAAMRMAAKELASRKSGDTPGKPPRRVERASLAPGTQLVRTWRGRVHRVLVLNDGKSFGYQDQTFKSLSEIARLITGARWSGPRFFGLQGMGGQP